MTSALVTSTAYKCNNFTSPSTLVVRHRQQGHNTWIEQLYNNPAQEIVITGQFQYGTVYEFKSRLVYGSRVGAFSHTLRTLSPGKTIFIVINIIFCIHKLIYRL